jgi:hypothetical protein
MLNRFRSLLKVSEQVRPQRSDLKFELTHRQGCCTSHKVGVRQWSGIANTIILRTMGVDEIRSRFTAQPVTARELT